MTGLATLVLLVAVVAVPIVFTGMLMLPGMDDAEANTTVNRPPGAGVLMFFYLLGFRSAKRWAVQS